MESSLSDSGLIKLEDDNQILVQLGEMLNSMFAVIYNLGILSINYLFLPVSLMFSFWAYAYVQMWKIAKYIFFEIYDLMHIVPLTYEILFWLIKCLLEFSFVSKSEQEISAEVEQNIYTRIKKILLILNALPLSHKHATGLYSFFEKIPLFSEGRGRLPFPNFLFEDTFTKGDFQKGTISMTLTPAENSSQSATETQTSIETPNSALTSAVVQPKRSIVNPDDKVKLKST